MARNLTITLLAFVMMLVIAALSGCGTPTATTPQQFTNTLTTGNTTGTTSLGSLTLSGTGTALTGTTYNALSIMNTTAPMGSTHSWYNVSPIGTYPAQSLYVSADASGNVLQVLLTSYTSSIVLAGAWGIMLPASTSVSTSLTLRTVTFTNLALPGALGTTTSLTVNGTLKY